MKLTQQLLIDAVNKSIENAGQLIEEAKILFESKRFARAYTLYQLSIEEVGKASMTFGFLLSDGFEDEKKQKQFFRDFRDHKFKTVKATGIDYIIARSIDNKEISKVLVSNMLKQQNTVEEINNTKNYSLYTSLFDEKFFLPSEMISEEMADDLGFYALIRHSAAKQLYGLAIQELSNLREATKEMNIDKFIDEESSTLADLMK